jgi:hypothetical protein
VELGTKYVAATPKFLRNGETVVLKEEKKKNLLKAESK